MTLIRTREDLGERNRRQVLSEILLNGPLARSAIAARVGLTNASVSRITRDLIDSGLVETAETYAGRSGRGRRFVSLRIRPQGGYVVGIAINAFRQDVVVADIGNRQIGQRRLALDDLGDPDTVLAHCATQLLDLLDETGVERHTLLGCGVTITGAIDPGSATLRSAPAIGWTDVNIRSALAPLLDMPLVVDSIANAKHLAAHYFGPAKNCGNTLLINASLAIGASVLLDGRLIRGHRASVGLIEAMLVPDRDTGALQPVDQVAGGYGALARTAWTPLSDGQAAARALIDLIDRAATGDDTARAALRQAGGDLAWIAAQSTALLHPETLLISGPLLVSQDYCAGIERGIDALVDADSRRFSVDYFPIESIEAAQSLAIYHFLVSDQPGIHQLPVAEGF